MARLIDADALKKLKVYSEERREYVVSVFNIDNAPTVPLPDFKEGYKQAIRDGKTNYSRPHGKWITHQTGMLLWEQCNQCSAQVGTIGMNFCPNCGADMREADNE